MNVKELYEVSLKEMKDILPSDTVDFRLEEANYQNYNDTWALVVSYLVPKYTDPLNSTINDTYIYPASKYERVYKTVNISKDGDFMGFKIYQDR